MGAGSSGRVVVNGWQALGTVVVTVQLIFALLAIAARVILRAGGVRR